MRLSYPSIIDLPQSKVNMHRGLFWIQVAHISYPTLDCRNSPNSTQKKKPQKINTKQTSNNYKDT